MRIRALPPALGRAAQRNIEGMGVRARQRHAVVQWIEARRRAGMGRDDACRIAGVHPRSYARWAKALRDSGPRALEPKSSRPRTPRRPWKRREVGEAVERLRGIRPCGKEKLAVLLRREGYRVSASTVGRVLRALHRRGRIEPVGAHAARGRRRRAARRPHARRKRAHERARRAGQLVQLDTLVESSQVRSRWQFSAVDPVSRHVHARLVTRPGSAQAARFLEACLDTWPHPIESIQVDNGSEFKGAFERVCAERGIELVTIAPASPRSNGCVERLQRTFRDEYYAVEPAHEGVDAGNDHLQAYLHYYNHERPHHALDLRTPSEYTAPRNPQTRQTS